MNQQNPEAPIRLDKWLWAARFFRRRSLAAEAIGGGKVELNGQRAKPGRTARAGDKLAIRRGPYLWTMIVKDVSRLRGPAPQARQLYEETEESIFRREAAIAPMRLERPPELDMRSRPSKKDRRAMARFTKRGW
jgi:ribosome-associated heat shock protein Hsp15